MEFNIQRQGRKWSRDEIKQKYHELCPEKIELIEGKMFWTDENGSTCWPCFWKTSAWTPP